MNGVEMTYEDDIEAFKSSNEEAYKELMENYKKPLVNLVYSIISDYEEAEEIVQDTFVSFYIKRERVLKAGRKSILGFIEFLLIGLLII